MMPLPSDVIASSSNQDAGDKSSATLTDDSSSSSLTVANNRCVIHVYIYHTPYTVQEKIIIGI